MKLVVSRRPYAKLASSTSLTSENDAYEGEYVAVAEGTHDVHFSHKILFSLPGRRLFQYFDSHNLGLLAVLSS
jgi:hypothetical protein